MTSFLESPICVGATSSTLEVKLLMDKKVLKEIKHLSLLLLFWLMGYSIGILLTIHHNLQNATCF
jgi:hypothetical protein